MTGIFTTAAEEGVVVEGTRVTRDDVALEWKRQSSSGEDLANVVAEIRTLSRLEDPEIARLVGVARETINRWGSGDYNKAIEQKNLHHLCTLRDLLRDLDAKPLDNRTWMFSTTPSGPSPYDLLVAGRYFDVRRMILEIPDDREMARHHITYVPAPIQNDAGRSPLDEEEEED